MKRTKHWVMINGVLVVKYVGGKAHISRLWAEADAWLRGGL